MNFSRIKVPSRVYHGADSLKYIGMVARYFFIKNPSDLPARQKIGRHSYRKFLNQLEWKRFEGFNDHRWDNRGIPLEDQEDAEDKRLTFKFSK